MHVKLLLVNGGFILKHGVGHKSNGTEMDVSLTYGDYYVEAMRRYKAMKAPKAFNASLK